MTEEELDDASARYAILSGDPGRSPSEEAERVLLRALLKEAGRPYDWPAVPIDPELAETNE